MRILVTCFEPFGGDTENASERAARALGEMWSGDAELVIECMPVAFGDGVARLREAVHRVRPDALLAVGENGTSSLVQIETLGRNSMDARIPDNAGEQPRGVPVDDAAGAPATRAATFDAEDIVARMRARGIPAELSSDAGLFVCNTFAYVVPSFGPPAGFVHVPALRTYGAASVGAETHPDALRVAEQRLTFADLGCALAAALDSLVAQVR